VLLLGLVEGDGRVLEVGSQVLEFGLAAGTAGAGVGIADGGPGRAHRVVEVAGQRAGPLKGVTRPLRAAGPGLGRSEFQQQFEALVVPHVGVLPGQVQCLRPPVLGFVVGEARPCVGPGQPTVGEGSGDGPAGAGGGQEMPGDLADVPSGRRCRSSQCLGAPGMQLGATSGGQVRQDGVAEQFVGEAPAVVAEGFDQSQAADLLERRTKRVVTIGETGQGLKVELRSHDRRPCDEVPPGGGQRAHDPVDGGDQRRGVALQIDDVVASGERHAQLVDEQWIPAGEPAHRLDDGVRGLRTGAGGQERRDVVVAQPGQVDAATVGGDLGKSISPVGREVVVADATGRHDQEPAPDPAPHDQVQQPPAPGVGVVEVVDDQDGRPLGRHHGQERDRRVIEGVGGTGHLDVGGRAAVAVVSEARHDRSQMSEALAQNLTSPFLGYRGPRLREDLGPRPVAGSSGVGRAPAHEHRVATRSALACELVDERRLADAGGPGDHDGAAVALGRVVGRGMHGGHIVVPTEKEPPSLHRSRR
jgi:hypothetical protein